MENIMYTVNRLRDIRELDLFLFGGIPETPEPMFERDTHSFSESRTTRCGIISTTYFEYHEGAVVGYLAADPESGDLIISEFMNMDDEVK